MRPSRGSQPGGPTGRDGRAAQAVADRLERPRPGPEGQDRRRCGGGAGGCAAGRPRPRLRAARAVPRGHPRRPGAGSAGARASSRCSATGRPAVDRIVDVESATRPTLTADLAEGLSRLLHLPRLDGPPSPTPPSARLGCRHRRVAGPGGHPEVRAARRGRAPPRRVLLVDDLVVPGGPSPWPPRRCASRRDRRPPGGARRRLVTPAAAVGRAGNVVSAPRVGSESRPSGPEVCA